MGSFTPSRQVKIMSVKTGGKKAKVLPFGRKIGPIKVGPDRPKGNPPTYFAQCDCGRHGWYQPKELLAILEDKSGCGHPQCSALSFRAAVWHSKDSLRLQLFSLLLFYNHMVQSRWGGSFDDMYSLPFDEAYENLLEDLEVEGVWLNRIDPELPFMEGNVRFGRKPDIALQRVRSYSIPVEGIPMRVTELCELSGLGAFDLLMKIYKLGTTDDLLINIMEA